MTLLPCFTLDSPLIGDMSDRPCNSLIFSICQRLHAFCLSFPHFTGVSDELISSSQTATWRQAGKDLYPLLINFVEIIGYHRGKGTLLENVSWPQTRCL